MNKSIFNIIAASGVLVAGTVPFIILAQTADQSNSQTAPTAQSAPTPSGSGASAATEPPPPPPNGTSGPQTPSPSSFSDQNMSQAPASSAGMGPSVPPKQMMFQQGGQDQQRNQDFRDSMPSKNFPSFDHNQFGGGPGKTPSQPEGNFKNFQGNGQQSDRGGQNESRSGQDGQNDQRMNDGGGMSKADEGRTLANFKRGLSMMDKSIAMAAKRLASFQAKGISIPQEVSDAIAKAKTLLEQARAVDSVEKMQDVDMSDFGDLMQTINDNWQRMEMAAQFPKILKQAARQLSQSSKEYDRAVKKLAAAKINAGSIMTDWKTELDSLSDVLKQAQDLANGGNAEDAANLLQDNFYDKFNDLQDKQQVVQVVASAETASKYAAREIKAFQKKIAALKRKGEDTADLEDFLNKGNDAVNSINNALSAQPIDTDTLIEALQSLQELKNQFDESYNGASGDTIHSKMTNVPGLGDFQPVETPKGFQPFMGKDKSQSDANSSDNGSMPEPPQKKDLKPLLNAFPRQSFMANAWESVREWLGF